MSLNTTLTTSDADLLLQMLCCVIAADKRVSGKEVQVVADTLSAVGDATFASGVKDVVIRRCKEVHSKGVDVYVAELIPLIAAKQGSALTAAFTRVANDLMKADGEATAEEQRVASLLIQAMGAAQAPTPVMASQDGPNPAPEQAHSSVQRSASVAANSVPASFPQRIASLICIAACFTLAITLLDRVLGGGWRSIGSMTSSFLLMAFGLLPAFAVSQLSPDEKQATRNGLMAGGIAGLAYGAILPGGFFGACVGAGSAFLAKRFITKASAGVQVAAVGLALVAAHALGMLPPTRIENASESRKRLAEAEAANPKGRLNVFKAVVAKFKEFPDRFAPESQREAYNQEMGRLVREFTEYPFDAKANPSIARSIVELFEAKIEGRYSGYQYNLIEECVRNIYSDSLNR